MADTSPKTFPGVYTTITDQSFLPTQISRFRPALIGVASKGPFDTPIVVQSLKEYLQVFGQPITGNVNQDGTPNGNVGHYLADAVGMVVDFTNNITIVRVGNKYQPLPSPALQDASGMASTRVFGTANSTAIAGLLAADPSGELYLTIKQNGSNSTVGVKVSQVGNGTVALDSTTDALAASYSGAAITYSKFSGAANSAEGVVYAYGYTNLTSTFGTITGNKNEFKFDVQQNPGSIVVGGVYKITCPSSTFKKETHEVRVKSVINNTVFLETSDVTRIGYQTVALQDTYDSTNTGVLSRATSRHPFLWLQAKSEGSWANGANATQGLYVKVRPGSAPGTKKIEIYENGRGVETHDNLSNDSASADYYETRLAVSQYVTVVFVEDNGGDHAANTVAPWDAAYYDTNTGSPLGMPTGAVNAGDLSFAGTSFESGGQFSQGFNGENAQEADFIGDYDPDTDTLSGMRTLEDPDIITSNIIAAPMDLSAFGTGSDPMSGIGVMQKMADVAKRINAMALSDVPPNLNATAAVDWHNGVGVFETRPRIDNCNIAIYWNWFHMTDRFTGLSKLVPPSLAALRCAGFTFQRDKPWYAFAGYTRGWVPEINDLQYEKVSVESRHAMYGNGNSVNPILKLRGRFYIFGERTMQVAESKLTAIHNVNLVNYTVTGLAEIGRQFVFDPNDLELLVHIRLAFSEYLDKIRNERGLEDYELVVDERNNTADTRNRREVIVDLAVIPTDVAERIFINATVRESGAQLNTVNS